MARIEQYEHQHTLFVRTEIDGQPLAITVKHTSTMYRGKACPTETIRWKGLHKVRFGDKEQLADESMIFDSGPKLGVSVCVTPHPEVEPTAEERAANRERIREVCRDIFGCRAIFPDEKEEVHDENGHVIA